MPASERVRSSRATKTARLCRQNLSVGLFVGTLSLTLAGAAIAAKSSDHSQFDFGRNIAPILTERCAVCHNSDKREGGLDVTSRKSLLEGGDSGPAIVPGSLEDSLLFDMVSGDEPMMPKDAKPLSKEQLAALRSWIASGAVWPDHAKVSAELWSLRPVKRLEPPTVKDREWVNSPIDAFILLLGIDHTKLTHYHNGIERRLTDVHGHVIKEILS